MKRLLLATTAFLALAYRPRLKRHVLETGAVLTGAPNGCYPVRSCDPERSAGLIQLNGTGGPSMDVSYTDVSDDIRSLHPDNTAIT